MSETVVAAPPFRTGAPGSPRRLRILICSGYFWPEVTGTGPYVTAPARYLAAHGHEVHVVTGFPHYPQWEALEPRRLKARTSVDGVQVHRRWHAIPHAQSALGRALYEGTLLCGGATCFMEIPRPDAIFGVTPTFSGASMARLASAYFRRPFGLVVHDLMGRGAVQAGVSGGQRVSGFVERLEVGLARAASQLVVLTTGFKNFFVHRGVSASKIHVLPTWTLRQPATADREVVRLSAGWSEEDFVVLYGGNMGQKQGLDNVVDAARLLQEAGESRVRLILVGDGNDRPRLSERARELALSNLEFMEVQPPRRYDELLIGADVLLMNQRAAVADMSLPSKLTSYFASGTPVIAAVAADSVAANEVMRADAGLVIPPEDPDALARELLSLRAAPERLRAMGQRGKDYALNDLSEQSILPRYEPFVERIAGCGSSGSAHSKAVFR